MVSKSTQGLEKKLKVVGQEGSAEEVVSENSKEVKENPEQLEDKYGHIKSDSGDKYCTDHFERRSSS